MKGQHSLTPGQFHFLQSIRDRTRTGGGILDYLEPLIGTLSRHRFYDLTRTLAGRGLVKKTRRAHSQIIDFAITPVGLAAVRAYEAVENQPTIDNRTGSTPQL